MGCHCPVSIFLLLSIAAISNVNSGIINNKIREKRSYIHNCQEQVIQNPLGCEKVECPEGPTGPQVKVWQSCEMPDKCPETHSDACCNKICVCGDGNKRYLPGQSFEFSPEPGKNWDCKCRNNSVPFCEEYFIVPPKQPTRPPPTFPPFPPFPGFRDEEQN